MEAPLACRKSLRCLLPVQGVPVVVAENLGPLPSVLTMPSPSPMQTFLLGLTIGVVLTGIVACVYISTRPEPEPVTKTIEKPPAITFTERTDRGMKQDYLWFTVEIQ